ncbi:MAG: asparaginase [Clostridia bacterium]|nr:asparaginase [Clostridia bacterium]
MRKRILLIATGGTIAAGETENGLAPQLQAEALLRFAPEIQSLCRVTAIQLCELDSTDFTPDIWLKIADCIEQNYAQVDGFVVTHGTDTLAFTAAAVSYLIQESGKPVVLTGAQNPIDTDGSDAPKNLFDAFLYAVSGAGGVSVVFGGRVIAGTRAKKLYTRSDAAFASVNFPYFAEIADGEIQTALPPQSKTKDNPKFYHELNTRVAVFTCIPGVSAKTLLAVAESCDGLILETYGLGGVPAYLYAAVEAITKSGKTVAVGTQVLYEGTDMSVYAVGKKAKTDLDILELRDMTTEAAAAKLMWILPQTDNPAEIRRLFETPIAFDRRES